MPFNSDRWQMARFHFHNYEMENQLFLDFAEQDGIKLQNHKVR